MNHHINPDKTKSALLIIDVQRDFTLKGAPAQIPGTLLAVKPIQQLVRYYRRKGKPIIHVIRLYQADGSNVDLCRKKDIQNGKQMVIVGSEGAEIIDDLKPSASTRLDSNLLLSGKLQRIGESEWIMFKPRWGAFYKTELESHLHHLGIDTVIVCGCNFPNCPRTTMYEASERDFKIVFIKDATSLVYEKGLGELKNIGISLKDTNECLSWLGST